MRRILALLAGAAVVAGATAVAVAVAAPAVPLATPTFSLWTTTTTPHTPAVTDDNASVELGTRITIAQAGTISAIRFYKGSGNTGTHTGTLWSANGRRLTSGTFTNETATGWQTLTLPQPFAVGAGTTVIASYHDPHGRYADDIGYFARRYSAGPLSVPPDGGVYAYGPGPAFPTQRWRSSNYWVDVVFTPATTPVSTTPQPPTQTIQPTTTTQPGTVTSSPTGPPPSTTRTAPPSTLTSPTQSRSLPPPTTSIAPLPTAWPTPATTGATGSLTPAAGNVTLGTNGQVYANIRLAGTLTVTACNVTIRNVEVDAGESYTGNSSPDLFAIWDRAPVGCTTTIDHVSVLTNTTGPAPYATEAVRDAYGATQTILASRFVGQQLGVTVGSGDTIRDSYMELGPTMRGDHNEDVLDDGTSGLTIDHNTLLNPNGQTSVLSLFTEFGSNRNFLIENNLLAGGGYTCYCGDGQADNAGSPAPASNVSFINNVFWRRYFPNVGQYGPGRAFNPAGGGQWTGNVFMGADGALASQLVPQPALDGR